MPLPQFESISSDFLTVGDASLGYNHFLILLLPILTLLLILVRYFETHLSRRSRLRIIALLISTAMGLLCAALAYPEILIFVSSRQNYALGFTILAFVCVAGTKPETVFTYLTIFAIAGGTLLIGSSLLLSHGWISTLDSWSTAPELLYSRRSPLAISAAIFTVAIPTVLCMRRLGPIRIPLAAAFGVIVGISLVRSAVLAVSLSCLIGLFMQLIMRVSRFSSRSRQPSSNIPLGYVIPIFCMVLFAQLATIPTPESASEVENVATSEMTQSPSAQIWTTSSPNPAVMDPLTAKSIPGELSTDSISFRIRVWADIAQNMNPWMPPIQATRGNSLGGFVGSHSAYVEGFRTLGILGVLVIVIVLARIIIRNRRNQLLLPAVIGVLAFGVFWDFFIWSWIVLGVAMFRKTPEPVD